RAVDQHLLAGHRVKGLVGEPVVRAVGEERDEDQDPRIEAAARAGLLLPLTAEGILTHVRSWAGGLFRCRARPGSRRVRWCCRRAMAPATSCASAAASWPRPRPAPPASCSPD